MNVLLEIFVDEDENRWSIGDVNDGVLYTCALGAAAVGLGITIKEIDRWNDWNFLYDQFPLLKRKIDGDDLINHIWKMNDIHKLSREQIADWVAEQEIKLEGLNL